MTEVFKTYWRGQQSFWRAFWVWAIAIPLPILYQPLVLKILWACRHNHTREWPVALAFSVYIVYYAISLLGMIVTMLYYVVIIGKNGWN